MTIVDDVRESIMDINSSKFYINRHAFYQNNPKSTNEQIPFPYKRYYIDVSEMYDNLQKFHPRIKYFPMVGEMGIHRTSDKFNIRPRIFGNWKETPLLSFDGKYTAFDTNVDDYEEIDMITDYFTEQQRLSCNLKGYPSPLFQWESGDIKITEKGAIDQRVLRDKIWKATHECTSFKVTLARSVYMLFKAKRVLDISSGWGDRLIAALSVGADYTGFDPNRRLQDGYSNIISRFGGKAVVTPLPFEDGKIETSFDLIFTSPPFFDFELYQGQDTSTNRYPTIDMWMVRFLFKSLQKAWTHLEQDGNMVIHITDIGKNSVVEPMIYFVEGWCEGSNTRGMLMSTGGDSGRARPMWVWSKTGQDTSKISRKKMSKEYPHLYKLIEKYM